MAQDKTRIKDYVQQDRSLLGFVEDKVYEKLGNDWNVLYCIKDRLAV